MKKRSLCFKYGSFSAALLALALGMASCHLEKKNGTDQSRAIKTEDITWEEKPSSEGCKLAAAYPTDNSSVVTQNIREWMNEQLGGTYTGSLDDGKKLLEYTAAQTFTAVCSTGIFIYFRGICDELFCFKRLFELYVIGRYIHGRVFSYFSNVTFHLFRTFCTIVFQ